MHTLHVITKVPVAREAITGDATLTAFIGTEEGFVAMAMHSVGLTLVTEETGSGGEMEILTGKYLATVWLQMRVHEFASTETMVSDVTGLGWMYRRHTRSCT